MSESLGYLISLRNLMVAGIVVVVFFAGSASAQQSSDTPPVSQPSPSPVDTLKGIFKSIFGGGKEKEETPKPAIEESGKRQAEELTKPEIEETGKKREQKATKPAIEESEKKQAQELIKPTLEGAAPKPSPERADTTATHGLSQAAAPESAVPAPELVLQTGYSGGVRAISFTWSGQYLASAGVSDPTVRLWDMTSGRELRVLPTGLVGEIAFSSDDSLMATLGGSGTKIWEVASGRQVRALSHQTRLQLIRFSPVGKTLAAASGNTIVLWDVSTGQKVHTLTGHSEEVTAIAFSHDGRSLASGSADKTIKVWAVETGSEIRTLTGHSYAARSLAFSRSGSMLASFSPIDSARIWELASGRALSTLPANRYVVEQFRPITFSADDRSLIWGGSDSTLAIWDVASERAQNRQLAGIARDDGTFSRGAFSPDGRWVALGLSGLAGTDRGEIRVWEVSNGRLRQRLLADAGIRKTVVSPDGRWIASNRWNDGTVALWEAASGRVTHQLTGHFRHVLSVVFSPDSRHLLVSSYNQGDKAEKTHIWEVRTGREFRVLNDTHIMAISGGGDVLARRIVERGRGITNNIVTDLWNLGAEKRLRTLDAGYKLGTDKYSFFTPDGKHVITASINERAVLWDVATGRELSTIIREPWTGIAMSADGLWLASGAREGIKLIDVSTGRESRNLQGPLGKLMFSPDGRLLASWHRNNLALLNVASGREMHRLSGHAREVWSVAFTADSQHVLSTSQDGITRVWDTRSGAHLATLLSLKNGGEWLVVTPEGYFDGSSAAWSQISWRFGGRTFDVVPLEAFFNEFFYPGLLADILVGKRPKPKLSVAQIDRRQPELKLTLTDPHAAAWEAISTRTVTVSVQVVEALGEGDQLGSSARDVRLFRNGALVKLWRGDVLEGKASKGELRTAVPIVAGENRLTAYAFNRDNVKSTDAVLTVNGAESLKRPGTAYILAVGVNEYANPDYNLKYAVADAKTFGDELLRQQTNLGAFGRVEVIPLLDRDATKTNILKALERLAGADALPAGAPPALQKLTPAQPEDAVIVYFAGHGIAEGPRFYLIPHDLGYSGKREKMDGAGLKTLLAHSVSDLELEKAFEKVDAGRLILVIDACESGQALEAEEKRRGPMNSKGLAQLAYEKGMYVLTAAQGYQAALEAEKLGHGLFTYALVEEGLKTSAADTAPKDGQVAVREWFDFATLRVPELQMAMMEEARKQGREIVFVDGERSISELTKRSLQRPRAFYRPDPEAVPFIVAKPVAR